MNKIDLETMTRMRNKATQELSIKLKRMPTDSEITLEVCRWIANAYELSDYETNPGNPTNQDMISAGYWEKEKKNENF